jgi:hypothetical protein
VGKQENGTTTAEQRFDSSSLPQEGIAQKLWRGYMHMRIKTLKKG